MVYGPLIYGTLGEHFGLHLPVWAFWVAGFGLLLLVALSIAWQVVETLALRTTTEDRALSDAPSGTTEYPVEIVLYDAHGSYGGDRGFVWFEDGLLTFNGTACSFVLAAEDFYHRRERDGYSLHAGIPGDALRFRTPNGTFYVRLRPLAGLKGLGFDYRLGRFLRSVPDGDRPRQWPPFLSYGMQPTLAPKDLCTPETIGEAAARTGSAFGVVRTRP